MRGFTLLFFLIFAVAAPITALAEDAAEVRITDIQVKGSTKVEAETIRTKMSVKVGDPFSVTAVRDEVSAIYRMGYFDDVRVEAEGYAGGLRLIFDVVERPIIRSYVFEGNENLEASKLREKVNLTPYSIYNPALVSENDQMLELFYQSEGYFNAKVMPVVERVTDKEVKVIFLIDEGDKVSIDDIEFVGNEKMSSRRLRKVMVTKEYFFLWSWLTGSGTYKLYDFSQDMDRILGLYYNNGYIQASVGEPDVVLDEESNELDITITVKEGEQFEVGNISFSGTTIYENEQLLEAMETESGDVMNREQLKDDIELVTDLYGMRGYAFATVTPVMDIDIDNRVVNLDMQVEEGELIYVNRIEITGNNKTRDNVIRRDLPFLEGERYNTAGLKASKERLKNLDYFEEVDVVPSRIPDRNEVDLDIRVREKSTGSFSVGGGYSTVDRLMAIGEIKQRNLFGRGQSLELRVQYGKRRHDFSLSFTEPWLFGKPISLSFQVFNEEKIEPLGYTESSLGGSISLAKRLAYLWTVTGTYSYALYEYKDVTSANLQVAPPGAFEPQTLAKLGMGLSRDTRDNYALPRRGSKSSIYGQISDSIIGSERSFYKIVGDSSWFFPFYWDSIFSLHGRAGVVFGFKGYDVPTSELFYVGGINTVRGYDWGTIGPKPPGKELNEVTNKFQETTPGQVIGGHKELIFNAEYTFPLVSEIQLRGVMFFDAGNAYGHGEDVDFGSLRYSAGGGFRWMSPMGLIRLEYGKVLDGSDPEQTGKWEFSMGTMF